MSGPSCPRGPSDVPRTEIQLGGFGGQGIISAGKIIGQAAAIYDGLEVSFTQSYGPEARGGSAGSQVVIASDPIHHPHLIAAHQRHHHVSGSLCQVRAQLGAGRHRC